MKSALEKRSRGFMETYNVLRENYKWSENDMFLRMASLIYASNDRPFDLNQFKNTVEHMKKNTSAFSSIRSYGKSTITSMLINNFENPDDAFDSLLMCCKLLKENKVGSDIYAALSAVVIMLSGIEGEDLDLRISKGRNLYGLMKKRHRLVTTRGDYPTVFILAGLDEDENELDNKVDEFYNRLNASGFKKGNGLLKMAQVLTLTGRSIDEAVNRCSRLQNKLKEVKVPIGTSHYTQVALLSLSQADTGETARTTVEAYDFLKSRERSKWLYSKQTVAMEALWLVSADVINEFHMQDAAQAGLGAAIQAMAEAQQMAIIAAVSASTSAAIAASAASSSH